MSSVRWYQDLTVWQRSMDLMDSVTAVCRRLEFADRLVYESQIRRAALSVASGIAEGHERNHTGEFRQFVFISRASLAEVETGLISIKRNCAVQDAMMQRCFSQSDETRRMLTRLGMVLKQKGRS
jgi:four helix bundle protein